MLKLLAISRNALVVVSGIVLFQDTVGPLQLAGYLMSLFFFGVYAPLLCARGRRALGLSIGPRPRRTQVQLAAVPPAHGELG